MLLGIEFVPGDVQRNFCLAGEALEFGEQWAILRFRPGLDRALVQSFTFVGNNEVEIEIDGVAETLAARAGAVRIVEGKQARLGLFVAAAVVLAFEALGKTQTLGWFAVARHGVENNFAGLAIADLDGIDDAGALIGGDDEAID